MATSIKDLKLRIQNLEKLLNYDEEAYLEGYIHALQQYGILLTDIDLASMAPEFRTELRTRYRAHLYEVRNSSMLKYTYATTTKNL